MPTVMDPQLMLPNPLIVQAVALFNAVFKVIPPVTVKVIPEFTVNVALAPVKVTEAQVVDTSPVRVTPLGIMTGSLEAGTPEGDHVAAVFQLPVLAVLVTCAKRVQLKNKNVRKNGGKNFEPVLIK